MRAVPKKVAARRLPLPWWMWLFGVTMTVVEAVPATDATGSGDADAADAWVVVGTAIGPFVIRLPVPACTAVRAPREARVAGAQATSTSVQIAA